MSDTKDMRSAKERWPSLKSFPAKKMTIAGFAGLVLVLGVGKLTGEVTADLLKAQPAQTIPEVMAAKKSEFMGSCTSQMGAQNTSLCDCIIGRGMTIARAQVTVDGEKLKPEYRGATVEQVNAVWSASVGTAASQCLREVGYAPKPQVK